MQSAENKTSEESISSGLRRFLYLTAAINGAAILIIEILGAKLLAPYLGTSHFVWTAQISVTLLALAAGYYLGGILVDRSRELHHLFLSMLAAAIYLALTLFITESVAYACLGLGLRVGSILCSLFLFFVPLTLLAMTGPFLIRILSKSIAGVGGQAGRLSAISTLGSVAGAVLIGYVLIPLLPNSVTVLVTSAILAILSILYRVLFGQGKKSLSTACIFALLSLAASTQAIKHDLRKDYYQLTEIHRSNSNFGMLQVLQVKGVGMTNFYYCNDNLSQNIYFKDTQQSGALFTYMLHGLAKGYSTNLQSALCIGLGVGIVPGLLAKEGVKVDAVEINEAVVPLAQRYFDLDLSRFDLHIEDGRSFLHRTKKHYDAVVLDAFLGDSSPSHLMTREAFKSMHDVLNPGGVVVMNCFGHLDNRRNFFIASLERTLESVFKKVKIHNSGGGNVFMVASDRADMELVPPTDFSDVHPVVVAQVRKCYGGLVSTAPDRGRILTDDYNPVDFYDAENREEFRRNMALGFRRN